MRTMPTLDAWLAAPRGAAVVGPSYVAWCASAKLVGSTHWGAVQTVFFAGGGTKGGVVVGSTDKIGAYAASDPQNAKQQQSHCAVRIWPGARNNSTSVKPVATGNAQATPLALMLLPEQPQAIAERGDAAPFDRELQDRNRKARRDQRGGRCYERISLDEFDDPRGESARVRARHGIA